LYQGHHLSQYKNFAELGAANLIAFGFAPDNYYLFQHPMLSDIVLALLLGVAPVDR
jgi:hypothetical protein